MLCRSFAIPSALLISVLSSQMSFAEVKLPPVFSDHMVLQRDFETPIWGTAAPGEEVSVSVNDQTASAKADEQGKWSVKLKPQTAGGPYTLTVQGTNKIEIKDVLVGEVWVGSGQSNMAGGVSGYAKNDEVLARLAETSYPKLRLCRGSGGKWQEATPENIKGYSALLFSFGQPLQQEIDVPVGLILGSVGGTPSGRWLTEEMLQQDEASQAQIKKLAPLQPIEQQLAAYEKQLADWQKLAAAAKAEGKNPPRQPTKPVKVGEINRGKIGDLYQAHIAPIVPYAIRGVLWDQGESGTALEGLDQFTVMGALIKGWRTAWGQDEFPFLYVQKISGGGCAWDYENPVTRMADKFSVLPKAGSAKNAGEYRELHIRIMQHPNTAMVTARDLGSGVHPLNKSGYGARSARVALGKVYESGVEIYGPIYESHKIEGNKIRLTYSHVGQGLASKHGETLQGFEVAGKDGVYHWAKAEIDGEQVVLSCDEVPEPQAARYSWAQRAPWANLFNKDGLPALAFRTSQK